MAGSFRQVLSVVGFSYRVADVSPMISSLMNSEGGTADRCRMCPGRLVSAY
jgi:hypothetical protein